jgi:hypothetical protein
VRHLEYDELGIGVFRGQCGHEAGHFPVARDHDVKALIGRVGQRRFPAAPVQPCVDDLHIAAQFRRGPCHSCSRRVEKALVAKVTVDDQRHFQRLLRARHPDGGKGLRVVPKMNCVTRRRLIIKVMAVTPFG